MRVRCAVALLLTIAARSVDAQVVRGQVIQARDSSAVPAVVVQLLDATGTVVGRTLSDDRGQFRLVARAPGVHRIRTLRIGFRPVTSTPLHLESGKDVSRTIALAAVPLTLDAVSVSARNACRVYADAGAAAELWDQARTAFTSARLSAGERRVAVAMTTYEREIQLRTEAVLSQRVYGQSGFTDRPWVSLSADSLRRVGYMVQERGGWTVYYAPDLDVLASDVFLADHCLRIAGVDSGVIGIAFEPTRDRARFAEIAGVAWLDRRTYELRRMEFRYVNVSRVHDAAAAGGSMDFLRVGNLWAISAWHIRMPVVERHAQLGRSPEERVSRLKIAGGELVLVRRGADTLWARPPLTLLAAITDSATGAPVPHARVELRGTELLAQADSTGRVAIPGVLPGVYTARVASLDMQALGASHEQQIALTQPGDWHRIALPTINYSLGRLCPGLGPRDGVVVGRVTARGDPAPPAGLQVFARWDLISVRETAAGVQVARDARATETTTRRDGSFTLCHVPTMTRLSLRTPWDGRGTGLDARVTGDRRVLRADLVVDRPRGSFRGRVVDVGRGLPIANVEVLFPMLELEARSDSAGAFAFGGVPEGTHEIVFRRVGYGPVSIRRAFQRDSALTERIVMAQATVMDPVQVRAQYALIPGFDNRRVFQQGHAITREELERLQHRPLGEILGTVPGLRLLRASMSAWASAGRGASTINLSRVPDPLSTSKGAKPGCYSDVYLDGALIYGGYAGAPLVDLNSFAVSNLEAVEYFAGPAQVPPEYNKTGAACGVLLLWSRRPGTP
jgi:hypothetical protein